MSAKYMACRFVPKRRCKWRAMCVKGGLSGHNPFQVKELWRAIYSSAYTQRPDLSLGGILSAVEMACRDIIGKETGRPVYELLGGRVRDTLRSYTYPYPEEGDNGAEVYENPQAAARRAVQYVEQRFTAVKFDPAGPYTIYDPRQLTLADLRRSEEFMRELHTAVGDTCDLIFGTHGQMTPAAAVRLAKRLEPPTRLCGWNNPHRRKTPRQWRK